MKNIAFCYALGAVAALALSPFACTFAADPPAPAVSMPAATTAAHTFVFVAPTAKTVCVAGTFNDWNKGANPLARDPDGKTWRVTLPVAFGKQYYKFVVDDAKWFPDPAAPVDAGGGDNNSVLLVTPPDYDRPASPSDGVLAASAVQHLQVPPYLNYDRGHLTLSLRLRTGDASSASVIAGGTKYPLRLAGQDELYARYVAAVPWDRKTDLTYRFTVSDGDKVFGVGANGLTPTAAAAAPFTLAAKTFTPFVVPGWVERGALYQIFPDRFANGDPRNDPADVQPADAKPTYYNRFGGDAAGVRKHLDYLQSLGVGAVYFNPVFASPSNHRYDTTDYHSIDPQFGTNAEFSTLTADMKSRGIRTVMDFVLNHTATNFAPFADIRKNGAASSYKDWYYIQGYPIHGGAHPNYTAWFGFESMPKLNVMNPATHEYLLGLVPYWRERAPLSGMRLDVAGEVDQRLWRDLRREVKATDPDIWIVGEFWGNASQWLQGDQWDSVMNYQFRDACLRFVAEGKTKPSQFADRLMSVYAAYPPQVDRNLMNLLSSHDTPRFLTLCGENAALDRLAVAVQFTWVGAPSIYYGEEIGMSGGADPDNRRMMDWARATDTNPMLTYYKKMIAIRKSSRALQSGDPVILQTDDAADTLSYARVLDNDAVVVVINRSSEPRTITVPLGGVGAEASAKIARAGGFVDALTGTRVGVSAGGTDALMVSVPGLGAAVLLRASALPR